MRHARAVLFYAFIVIFIATAVVTLLGLTGVLTIDGKLLAGLVTALLVELAAAVIALFRRTDFFAQPSDNLATSLGSAIEALDSISDEVEGTIKRRPVNPKHVHRYLIRRIPGSVAAYSLMRVIEASELDQLPREQREMIRSYEKSMSELLNKWRRNNRKAESILSETTRNRQMELLRAMKEQIVGLLNYMERIGVYLDDHYQEVRHLVSQI